MARAQGSRVQLLGKEESVYGTAPSGNWAKFLCSSTTLGAAQPLIDDDTIGNGRDPVDPSYDVITADGEVVVPVELRDIGFWLNGLLGAETVTGTDPYTHVWKSGALTLPSLSLEVGNPEVPSFRTNVGCIVNTGAFEFAPSGTARATFGIIAQGENAATTSGGGSPTRTTYTRFSQSQGDIKKDGSALGNVTGGTLNFSNGAEAVRTIRSDGKVDGIDPGKVSVGGTIKVRFADTVLLDAASGKTPVDLSFGYTIDADNLLLLEVPRIFLPKPKLTISGPGGIEATYEWRAAKDATAGAALVATLINDVATY